jgi:hypothetical protein
MMAKELVMLLGRVMEYWWVGLKGWQKENW